jgi:hypothetical protein
MRQFIKRGMKGDYEGTYKPRARDYVEAGIDDLELFANNGPEKELSKLLRDKELKPLVEAILGENRPLDDERIEHQLDNWRIYLIASMFVDCSLKTLVKLAAQIGSPYYNLFREEAERMRVWIRGLGYEANQKWK